MVLKNIGCRSEVFRGKAKRTSGGLKKEDIVRNKYGRYVSKERSEKAKESSHLGKWLFKKGGKPSNRSATNLLYETIAKEREMERKKVVPGRLYRKEATDSKPNPKTKLTKDIIYRAMEHIKKDGWKIVQNKKKPTLTPAQKRPPAKPIKKPKLTNEQLMNKMRKARQKFAKSQAAKKSQKKPDKSVYLLPEPGPAKKKKKEKPKPSFVKTGK